VAAGHASKGGDGILMDMDGEGNSATVLKALDEEELETFNRLWGRNYANDPVHAFTPILEGTATNEGGQRYIKMNNLLRQFRSPRVMDIKLGVRSFLEDECDNVMPRKDLFDRMANEYPKSLTPSEKEKGSVTKLRWMKLRDAESTLTSFGFRIDGIVGCQTWRKKDIAEELLKVRLAGDIREVFRRFTFEACNEFQDHSHPKTPIHVACSMVEQLQAVRKAFRASPFVRDHECIGSSLLCAADALGHVGVYWIDFGKTRLRGAALKHDVPWQEGIGSYEDGIFLGLDKLVKAWQDVIEMLGRGSLFTAPAAWSMRRTHSAWPEKRRASCGDTPTLTRANDASESSDNEGRAEIFVRTRRNRTRNIQDEACSPIYVTSIDEEANTDLAATVDAAACCEPRAQGRGVRWCGMLRA